MSGEMRTELLERVRALDDIKALRVLEFVKELNVPNALVTFADYQKLAGTIRPEVLDQMERAIQEGCERIDEDGWM